ncbi:MAG: hypothetical protein IVW51_15595 [Thermaceae bacterium]|nr:hypothetical protein [Thermaceae bacterium]
MVAQTTLLKHYQEIATVLARHGLGYLAVELGLGRYLPFNRGLLQHRPREAPYTRADHLRLALEELGPTFVKLGQILCTWPDLVPLDWSVELAKLQERVPPVPWDRVWLKLARPRKFLPSSSQSRWPQPPSGRYTGGCCTAARWWR